MNKVDIGKPQESRVFNNGNSQAVRIPAELRLDAERVLISRNTDGDLVIHPVQKNRGAALYQALCCFDDDFIEALSEDESQSDPMQDREPL